MAQNTWLNATVDKNAANKPDRTDHKNTVVAGAAAANDLTVSWDNAVVTSLAIFDSTVAAIRLNAISRGLK